MKNARMTIFAAAMCAFVLGDATVKAAPGTADDGGIPMIRNGEFDSRGPEASDYPAFEVQSVVPARAQAAAARIEHNYARTEMYRTVDQVREDLARSPGYRATVYERERAARAYETERNRVLSRLWRDEDYLALVNLRDRLTQNIANLREQKNVDAAELVAHAELKLEYSRKISAREAEALSQDEPLKRSYQTLLAAVGKLQAQEAEMDYAARRDESVVAARTRLQQATVQRVATATHEKAAAHARNIALDYATYVHRYDQYKYVNQSARDAGYDRDYYRSWYRR